MNNRPAETIAISTAQKELLPPINQQLLQINQKIRPTHQNRWKNEWKRGKDYEQKSH